MHVGKGKQCYSNAKPAKKKAKKVTVAFYGSPDFDVANLDPDSVTISGMKITGQGFDDGSCRAEYLRRIYKYQRDRIGRVDSRD